MSKVFFLSLLLVSLHSIAKETPKIQITESIEREGLILERTFENYGQEKINLRSGNFILDSRDYNSRDYDKIKQAFIKIDEDFILHRRPLSPNNLPDDKLDPRHPLESRTKCNKAKYDFTKPLFNNFSYIGEDYNKQEENYIKNCLTESSNEYEKEIGLRQKYILMYKGEEVCRGIFIDRKSFLTAKHCLQKDLENIYLKNMENNKEVKFNNVIINFIDYNFNKVKFNNLNTLGNYLDIALIEFDKDILNNIDSLPYLNDLQLNQNIYLYSYHPLKNRYYHFDKGGQCQIKEIINYGECIVHNCDTVKSMSGSALIVNHDNKFKLVGIHSGYVGGKTSNRCADSIVKDGYKIATSVKAYKLIVRN